MANGKGFSLVSAGDPPRPSTIMQILQEAATLLWRSWKPVLSISLILLLLHSLLFLGSYVVVNPLITDMVMKFFTMRTMDPRSPQYHELLAEVMKDLRELTGAEVAIMLISFLSMCFLLMVVVHTVAMARKGEQVTLKDLLCWIKSRWKGPVVTQIYVAVLGFGYTVALFMLIGVLAIVSNGSMPVFALRAAAVAVLAIPLLTYLQVVWNEGLVISVVEEDCYGLAALVRASELIRGRRRLGFSLSLLYLLITLVISVANQFVITHLPPGQPTQLVSGLLSVCAGLLMSVFFLVVYVVFYYECKKSHEEDVAMKESFMYTKVPTAPTLDGDLP